MRDGDRPANLLASYLGDFLQQRKVTEVISQYLLAFFTASGVFSAQVCIDTIGDLSQCSRPLNLQPVGQGRIREFADHFVAIRVGRVVVGDTWIEKNQHPLDGEPIR